MHPKPVEMNDSTKVGRLYKSAISPEFLPKPEKKMQKFTYTAPPMPLGPGKAKAIVRLGTTDTMNSGLQVILDGGETSLHAHAAMTGFWMVISGRARFFGEKGESYELNALEGVIVPRGTPYGFEKISEEPLVILQVESIYPGVKKNTNKIYDDSGITGKKPKTTEEKLARVALFDGRLVPPPE